MGLECICTQTRVSTSQPVCLRAVLLARVPMCLHLRCVTACHAAGCASGSGHYPLGHPTAPRGVSLYVDVHADIHANHPARNHSRWITLDPAAASFGTHTHASTDTCLHACIPAHINARKHARVCGRACVCVRVSVCVPACVCECACVCACVCVYSSAGVLPHSCKYCSLHGCSHAREWAHASAPQHTGMRQDAQVAPGPLSPFLTLLVCHACGYVYRPAWMHARLNTHMQACRHASKHDAVNLCVFMRSSGWCGAGDTRGGGSAQGHDCRVFPVVLDRTTCCSASHRRCVRAH